MKRLILLAVLVLSACAPRMSEDLKGRLNKVLEDGATLNAMTKQGAAFSDFSAQLAQTRGSYDLAAGTWPPEFMPDARQDLDQALAGWELARKIWAANMSGGGRPEAPDKMYYAELVAFAGESNLNIHRATYRTYIDLDDAIGTLFSLSSNHFSAAQALVLAEMR